MTPRGIWDFEEHVVLPRAHGTLGSTCSKSKACGLPYKKAAVSHTFEDSVQFHHMYIHQIAVQKLNPILLNFTSKEVSYKPGLIYLRFCGQYNIISHPKS